MFNERVEPEMSLLSSKWIESNRIESKIWLTIWNDYYKIGKRIRHKQLGKSSTSSASSAKRDVWIRTLATKGLREQLLLPLRRGEKQLVHGEFDRFKRLLYEREPIRRTRPAHYQRRRQQLDLQWVRRFQ